MEKHKIDVVVYKDYCFERVIAALAATNVDKQLVVVCHVGNNSMLYEVRKNGVVYGARTSKLTVAVGIYNSI